MAAGEGFEPSHTESESAVLPLHNPARYFVPAQGPLAAGEGFEPSHTESESAVLPLHNPAVFCNKRYYTPSQGNVKPRGGIFLFFSGDSRSCVGKPKPVQGRFTNRPEKARFSQCFVRLFPEPVKWGRITDTQFLPKQALSSFSKTFRVFSANCSPRRARTGPGAKQRPSAGQRAAVRCCYVPQSTKRRAYSS